MINYILYILIALILVPLLFMTFNSFWRILILISGKKTKENSLNKNSLNYMLYNSSRDYLYSHKEESMFLNLKNNNVQLETVESLIDEIKSKLEDHSSVAGYFFTIVTLFATSYINDLATQSNLVLSYAKEKLEKISTSVKKEDLLQRVGNNISNNISGINDMVKLIYILVAILAFYWLGKSFRISQLKNDLRALYQYKRYLQQKIT